MLDFAIGDWTQPVYVVGALIIGALVWPVIQRKLAALKERTAAAAAATSEEESPLSDGYFALMDVDDAYRRSGVPVAERKKRFLEGVALLGWEQTSQETSK